MLSCYVKWACSGCTFFRVLVLLFVIVFPYTFPIDSLLLFLTGSLGSGLLVVPRSVIKILIPMSGRKPWLCASWYIAKIVSNPLQIFPWPAANMICFSGSLSVLWKYLVAGVLGLPMIYPQNNLNNCTLLGFVPMFFFFFVDIITMRSIGAFNK